MLISTSNIAYKPNIVFILLAVVVNILLCVLVISSIPKFSIVILLGYILLLFLFVLYSNHIQNIAVFLVILSFVPLVYLNNAFHYLFGYELVTSLSLTLLFVFFVFHKISSADDITINITYIQKPILFTALYFTFLAIWDITNNPDKKWLAEQLYHIYLYLAIFPFVYFLTKRRHYHTIFLALLIISVFIALEYIVLNLFLVDYRFVTFQSGFLPIVVGVLFSYVLFGKKHKNRIISLALVFVVSLGAFVTLTRTVWVTTLLVFLFTWLFYLKALNKLRWQKLVFILLITSVPIVFVGDISKKAAPDPNQTLKYRAQSVVTPLEDSSFLMRVEFAYYATQRFLESPIIGKGLGDFLKYKIFFTSNTANYYLDNSWLYFLWKSGIIGFLLFVWIYVRFFKTAYYVLKHTENFKVKVIITGLLAGILGLMFLAFLSPLLIKYRTNIVFPLIFAY